MESLLNLYGIEFLLGTCVNTLLDWVKQSSKSHHNRITRHCLSSQRLILVVFLVISVNIWISISTALSRSWSFWNTSPLTFWVHWSKWGLWVRSIVFHPLSSSLRFHHLLDLILESIRVSDLSFVFINRSQHSPNVVKSQDTSLLGIVVSPSNLLIDHVFDLFIKFQIDHLLLQNVQVQEIELSHICVNVFVNFLLLKHHENLPFAPHFVHDVADDIITEDNFTSVSETKVNQNLFDIVELIKLVLWKHKLRFVIQLLNLFITDLSELRGLETLELSCPFLVLLIAVRKPIFWHDLHEHQEKNILHDFKLISVNRNELAAVSCLNLVFTEHFSKSHERSQRFMVHSWLFSLDDNLLHLSFKHHFPEVVDIRERVKNKNKWA